MIIIDVGTYDGSPYLEEAKSNPNLTVYAFEPNIELTSKIIKIASYNYHIFPLIVSEKDGIQEYYYNIDPSTNSILSFNPDNISQWNLASQLKSIRKMYAPSIRLDTFLRDMKITNVDFLKIDAQGADLQVIKSSGEKLNIFKKIQIEVCDVEIYQGGNTLKETLSFFKTAGYILKETLIYSQYRDLIFEHL